MMRVTEIGAIVAPPMPAFYHRPQSVEEIVDQTVNRLLDLLGLELPEELFRRWRGASVEAREARADGVEIALPDD
jgi:4-hydroxy-3-polyprenylbenzoate decarboxylase